MMVQWAKYPLCEHGNLSSDPRKPGTKATHAVQPIIPALEDRNGGLYAVGHTQNKVVGRTVPTGPQSGSSLPHDLMSMAFPSVPTDRQGSKKVPLLSQPKHVPSPWF